MLMPFVACILVKSLCHIASCRVVSCHCIEPSSIIVQPLPRSVSRLNSYRMQPDLCAGNITNMGMRCLSNGILDNNLHRWVVGRDLFSDFSEDRFVIREPYQPH